MLVVGHEPTLREDEVWANWLQWVLAACFWEHTELDADVVLNWVLNWCAEFDAGVVLGFE